MILLRLPYPPSTNRMWRRFGNRTVLSGEGRAYKAFVSEYAALTGVQPFSGPVQVRYTLHPRLTKKGRASETRIDLGNCEKVASDALNGIAWGDDKQIHRMVLEIGEPVPDGGLTARIDKWAPLRAEAA